MNRFCTIVLVVGVAAGNVVSQESHPNIGHRRHFHRHGEPHETVAADGTRFITNRPSSVDLPLPSEAEAFTFAIFGDRTGGPSDGVGVLADAVRDVNLFEPDLVMTVGDLVQGYNQTPQWLEQMREFKEIMDRLLCPWFPVAGNHDVYWRGEGEPPEGEHEGNYEMHFGPLWYAFSHKGCWFIALYSDEGDPETGEKNFNKPASQRMSDEQFQWLAQTLEHASSAEHVFLFLHHPRWLGGGYGDDWNKVHDLLVQAGNVRAVFAGHIHRMRYDPRDGIEYVALATVGGGQSGTVPSAGWLHQYHLVTVRTDQIAMAALPVGEVMDVREITGKLAGEAARLAQQPPAFDIGVPVAADGAAAATLHASYRNTATRPIELTAVLESRDSRWTLTPDHQHARLEPGESWRAPLHLFRRGGTLDDAWRPARLILEVDVLGAGARYPLPPIEAEVPLEPLIEAPARPSREVALEIDGRSGRLEIPSDALPAPQGPLTLECWLNGEDFSGRRGLVAKTENSDYGIFVSGGRPNFSIWLGGRYATVAAEGAILEPGRWHHIAGVYDGNEVRLYVDGRLIASERRSGQRRVNDFPLMIGADVDSRGRATSHFAGRIDGVRLSTLARYRGPGFEPSRRPEADEQTLLLLNFDAMVGPWLFDESPRPHHPRLLGGAELVKVGN